jgi:carbonic anhydrase
MVLLDKLKALGVDRHHLPENINEFFGMFATERQNVIKACGFARESPLIGPKIPVHGLIVDIATGKLDWVVNGYETWQTAPQHTEIDFNKSAGAAIGAHGSSTTFDIGEMKFPGQKIGEAGGNRDWSESPSKVPALPKNPAFSGEAAPIGQLATGQGGPPKIPTLSPVDEMRPRAAIPPIRPVKKPLPPPIKPRIVKL